MRSREDLHKAIDAFLAQHRTSDNGDWATVTSEDLYYLKLIIRYLLHLKFDVDEKGKLPVDFLVVDRTQHMPISYRPVPYDRVASTEEEQANVFDCLLANFELSSQALEQCIATRVFRKQAEDDSQPQDSDDEILEQ